MAPDLQAMKAKMQQIQKERRVTTVSFKSPQNSSTNNDNSTKFLAKRNPSSTNVSSFAKQLKQKVMN